MSDGSNHQGGRRSSQSARPTSLVRRQQILLILLLLSIAGLGLVVGIASPYFALIASICLLGLFDLLRPLVRIRLPRPIRKVHPWEVRSHLYRIIGVPAFGALLRKTPLRLLNTRVYLKRAGKDLSTIRMQMEDSEAAHFWAGLVTLPYLAFAWYRGWWGSFLVVVMFNAVANLYPILHLRSVRARLERAAHRRS